MEMYYKRKSMGSSSPLKKSHSSFDRYFIKVNLEGLPTNLGLGTRILNLFDK